MAERPQAISKLPKWAQDYIVTIERERQEAIRLLNEFVDGQTESRLWIDELSCTGEAGRGPSSKRHYIQSHKITFRVGESEVYCSLNLDNPAILHITGWTGQLYFQPQASNSLRIFDHKQITLPEREGKLDGKEGE